MTKGVTSADATVVIDGNSLCKLGTKSTALNGTNYTILPKPATPVITLVGNVIQWNTALEHEVWKSTSENGYYSMVASQLSTYYNATTGWYKAKANDGYASSDYSNKVHVT